MGNKEVEIPETHKKDFQKAILILKDIGCKEIYLFGSLVTGSSTPDSDIDLGVKGILSRDFFKIYSKLTDELSHPVNLVDFDQSTDFFNMLSEIKEVMRVA